MALDDYRTKWGLSATRKPEVIIVVGAAYWKLDRICSDATFVRSGLVVGCSAEGFCNHTIRFRRAGISKDTARAKRHRTSYLAVVC